MTILVAPSEPPELRALGAYSPLCEQFGSDILYLTEQGQMAGVQRKEIHDLVSSMGEHLNRELLKMGPLDVRILLIEGEWRWTSTGDSLSFGKSYGRVPRRLEIDGLLRSVQHSGIQIAMTDNLAHTAEWVKYTGPWLDKSDHVSLSVRGNGPRDMFGSRDATYQRLWWWQWHEGIGAKVAKDLDHWWGGKLPITYTVTREEWMKMALSPEKGGCPGIGKKRAEMMWANVMEVGT